MTGRLRAALDVVDADARALAVLDRIGDEIARDLAEAGPHRTIVIIQNVGRQTRRVEREASKAGVGAKAKEALLIIAAVATIFSAIPRQAAVATAPSQVHVHVEVQREDALAPGSYAYVSADNGLNVRIGDSVGEEVITTLPYGTKVQIIESDGPFSKIAFELADESRTRVGFAASEWLVLWADEDVPSGNPPPVPRD